MRISLSKLRAPGVGEAVPILAALVEVLWAYPWLVWGGSWGVLGWARPPLSLASAAVVVVAVEALSRYALARDWPLARVRLAVPPALALWLALAIRLEQGGGYALWDTRWVRYAAEHWSMVVGGALFGAYLVWRGMSVGRESPDFDSLYRRFLVGLAGLVALLVLSSLAGQGGHFPRTVLSFGPYVMAYFSAGLLALALANFQSIRAAIAQQAEASPLFGRRWLFLAVGAVLGIVMLATAIASVFSFDLLAVPLHYLSLAANWLLTAFIYLVLYPLGLVAAALVFAFRALTGLLGLRHEVRPERFTPPNLEDLRQAAEGQAPAGIPPWVFPALKWGLLALVVLLVMYLLARALLRYSKGNPEDRVEEVHESLWTWDLFKSDVRSFLARLLRRLWPERAAAPPPAVAPEAAADSPDQARLFSAREIYRALLWEGRQAGHPRSPWETPHEYGRRVHDALRDGSDELGAITEAYAGERYGGMPAGGQRLEQINHLWRALRSTLRGLP